MTADAICHGVASLEVLFRGWLSDLECARGVRVIVYEHRPKSIGRDHFGLVDGKVSRSEQRVRYSEVWERLFYGNRMLRPSCHLCPYTVVEGRSDDPVIADFWGVDATPHARGNDGELGVLLAVANNAAGLCTLFGLDVNCESAKIAEALPRNPMLECPSVCEGDHDASWRELYEGGMLSVTRRECYPTSLTRFFASCVKRAVERILGR